MRKFSLKISERSCALIQLGHYEFAVTQSFGAGQAAVASSNHDIDQSIAGLVERHFAAKYAGDIEINVLAHSARGLGIGGEFDDRLDGIADHVSLPGGEEVHDKSLGRLARGGIRRRL